MGIGCIKNKENVYFQARKEASSYNDRLRSRERAAEMLGISVSALADYELGNVKFVPVDKVVLMADLYNRPELKTGYCKHECPIGCDYPIATETSGLENIVLRVVMEFNDDRITEIKDSLVSIAADGKVSEDEKEKLDNILQWIDRMIMVMSELKLYGRKCIEKRK